LRHGAPCCEACTRLLITAHSSIRFVGRFLSLTPEALRPIAALDGQGPGAAERATDGGGAGGAAEPGLPYSGSEVNTTAKMEASGLPMLIPRSSVELLAFVALVVGGFAYRSASVKRDTVPAQGDQHKVRRGHAPAIGVYRLDMQTPDERKLVELSQDERDALKAAIQFKGERIYHAPSAEFAGASWDVVLGAVNSRVYKVSAVLSLGTLDQRNAMWQRLDGLLRKSLGTPASVSPIVTAWDTEDGNVVMNVGKAGGAHFIVLTLTSSGAATFERIK